MYFDYKSIMDFEKKFIRKYYFISILFSKCSYLIKQVTYKLNHKKMKIKSRKDALLKLFIDIGREGDREFINSKVPEYWELSTEEMEIEKGGTKPLYWHRVAGSCQNLKDKDGFLENPERGVWKITDAGISYIAKKLGLSTLNDI